MCRLLPRCPTMLTDRGDVAGVRRRCCSTSLRASGSRPSVRGEGPRGAGGAARASRRRRRWQSRLGHRNRIRIGANDGAAARSDHQRRGPILQGEERIREQYCLPPSVQISAIPSASSISAPAILEAVGRVRQCDLILVEGGPQLMGDFFAGQALDELFLTLSPQIAGRDGTLERPGLVARKRFAPEHPLWGTLKSVKRTGSHLFLRYAFEAQEQL